MHIKPEDFYKDIVNDVEKRFDTSSYGINRKNIGTYISTYWKKLKSGWINER